MSPTLNLTPHAQAAVWAALLGDALGVPYEFHEAQDLPALAHIEMTPPRGFDRSHRGTPLGTWSDDGAQLLALLDALRHAPHLSIDEFAQRLRAWYEQGAYTPDGRVFDIGLQTRRALEAMEAGVPPLAASEPSVSQNGNGSLMRVLPVAFLLGTPAERIRIARLQSVPTHAHVRAQLCCALYVEVVAALLAGVAPDDALRDALRTVQAHIAPAEEAEWALVAGGTPLIRGSGYVLDSVWAAWSVFRQSQSIEECLKRAVALGEDTDTTACIAGGLAGAHWGLAGLPARWMTLLRGQSLVGNLLKI